MGKIGKARGMMVANVDYVTIEVIHAPAGEFPEEVRGAWVGVRMRAMYVPHVNGSRGVLKGEYTSRSGPAYLVSINRAIEALKEAGKIAAVHWWQEHRSTFQTLVFDAQYCKEVQAN